MIIVIPLIFYIMLLMNKYVPIGIKIVVFVIGVLLFNFTSPIIVGLYGIIILLLDKIYPLLGSRLRKEAEEETKIFEFMEEMKSKSENEM